MGTVRTISFSSKFLSIVSIAAIGLLSACGEHGSSKAPVSSATVSDTKANSITECFYTVGSLSKSDAELFAASGAGDIRRVEQLVGANGNVNVTDAIKRTPLFAAAFCNHPEVANFLIDKGSNVNAVDFLGMSPLHAAVIVDGMEVAKTLISRGANVDSRSAVGRTPLHIAAATNQMTMVELLLESGANAQVRDKNGITAASLASNNGHPAVAVKIKKWQEKKKSENRAPA